MKKIYFLAPGMFFLSFFTGCSKDFLRSYEHRIEGSWRLIDVDRTGIGGSTSNLPFRDGVFTFSENGEFEYINNVGEIYKGSWDIRREWIRVIVPLVKMAAANVMTVMSGACISRQ